MPNLANLTLVGHLGRDPEIKFLPSGDPITEFSVAHTMKRKSGDVTTWWRCTAFGKSAEIASQFLAKGDAVMVIGSAYNEPWQDKDGADRLTLKVVVDRIVLLGKREAPAPTAADRQDKPAPKPEAKPAQKQAAEASNTASGFADMEDDIPFVFNECSVLNGMIELPRTITRAKRAHKTLHQLREGSSAF